MELVQEFFRDKSPARLLMIAALVLIGLEVLYRLYQLATFL